MSESASESVMAAPPVAPGWFSDPGDPSRERWWTGIAWSTKTHRPPRTWGFYPPAYIRSFWIGTNRAALVARVATTTAVLAGLFLSFLFVVSAVSPSSGLTTAIVLLLLLVAVFGPAGLIAGIVAVTRARRLGALGISIWSIVIAGTVTVLTLPWLIGWIALGIAGAPSGP